MGLPSVNIVMIGHIDHGKSTLIGRLLYDSGAIKEDKLKELKNVAQKLNKEFEFAHIMDAFEEEVKGDMTIDTRHIPLKSSRYEYTIIDAPGHKEFLKNMLTGASYADSAVVVISAKKDEGIQEQTKRHIFMAKFLGIKQLFVVINKMDTVNYERVRFDEICNKVEDFLKSINFEKSVVSFVPISAKEGDNVLKKSSKMEWYNGKSLIETLDNYVVPLKEPVDKPLRVVIQSVFDSDKGKLLLGKVETGILKTGDNIIFNPSGITGKVESIEMFNEKISEAKSGDSIGIRVSRTNIEKIKRGEVCSKSDNKPKIVNDFVAEIISLTDSDINLYDELIVRHGTSDNKCVIEEVSQRVDSERGCMIEKSAKIIRGGEVAVVKLSSNEPVVVEIFSDIPQLGRFVAAKGNKIVAAGRIVNVSSN